MNRSSHFTPTRWILAVLLLAIALAGANAAYASEAPEQARAQASVASVQGEVFLDANLNGLREPFETGVSDATVILTDAQGQMVGQAQTDAEGYYFISDLTIGSFKAAVSVPGGLIVRSNGAFEVSTAEVQAPALISTGVAHGLFIPVVSTR